MSDTRHLSLEIDAKGIATLRLGRPEEKVTVLSLGLMDELEKAVARIEADPKVKGLVLAGCREDMFAAGADIEAIKNVTDPKEGERLARKGQLVFHRIFKLPFPTVAAIGGPCLGGGFELALACRYRVASDHEKTRIGLPEVKLGILPGFGGTQRLPRVVGLPQALEVILKGTLYDPKRALKIGLVDEMLPAAYLAAYARKLAAGEISLRTRRVSRLLVEGNPISRGMIASMAKKGVLRETRGHYPAPLRAIESAVQGLGSGIEAGLEQEARLLGELIVSPESKNLVNLFFLMEGTKKTAELAAGTAPIATAAVIGCGVMGAGIGIAFAEKDIETRIRDIGPEAVAKGLEQARAHFRSKTKKKRMTPVEARAKLDRISPAIPPARLTGCDLVIEAVAEKMEVKKAVFEGVARETGPATILATNTSSLSVSELQKSLPNPERVVGIHFFNPVDKMPLVEIVRGERSSEQTVARAATLALRLGKYPIVVKDCPGFLVNRILAPYLNEAAYLLSDGASIEAIDAAAEAFGMPMGPIALLDEVGLDIGFAVGKTLLAGYGDRMKSPNHLEKLLEAGRKGKKSGAGFFVHEKGKRRPDPAAMRILGLSGGKTIAPEILQERLILPIVNEAMRCLEEGVVASPGDIDLGSIMGFGFPPFRGGVMRYVEAAGPQRLLERLKRYQQDFGLRFAPAKLFEEVANKSLQGT